MRRWLTAATMSSPSRFRFRAEGRSTWRRAFCDRPSANSQETGNSSTSGGPPLVSGDSHLRAVRDSNLDLRRGQRGGVGAWDPRRPPPQQPYRRQTSPPHPPPSYGYGPPPPQHFGLPPHSQGPPLPSFAHHQLHPTTFRPSPFPLPAYYRNWNFSLSQPPPQCERFVVLSYNILADYLAKDHRSQLYFHIPQYILDWEWRKKKLLLDFRLWAPDVMCLQEVDRFHDLEEELVSQGYNGIWKMRTGNAVDGCSVFWRTSRFQLRHEESIEFNKLGLRDNVAQICVLESRIQSPVQNESASLHGSYDQPRRANQVVICNIHVLYNPKRGEIKIGQVRTLLNRAHAISKIWNNAPVIVCGDFNCTPKSPLYNFITYQKLDLSGLARNHVSGQYSASRPYNGSAMHRTLPYANNISDSRTTGQQGINIQNNCEPQKEKEASNSSGEITNSERGSSFLDIPQPFSDSPFMNASSSVPQVMTSKIKERESLNNLSIEARSPDFQIVSNSEGTFESSHSLRDTLCDTENGGTRETSPRASCIAFQEDLNVNMTLESNEDRWSSSTDNFPSYSADIPEKSPAIKDALENDASEKIFTSHMVSENVISAATVSSPESLKSSMASLTLEDIKLSEVSASDNSKVDLRLFRSSLDQVSSIVKEESSYSTCLSAKSLCEGDSLCNNTCSSEENSDPTFFRELLGTEYTSNLDDNFLSPPISFQNQSASSIHSSKLGSTGVENQANSFHPSEYVVGCEKHFFNPYLWTPMEIEVASGSAEQMFVEHSLKLRSVYTDVEDYAGTKDSSREPQVTSYNRQFMGTVDYIWSSGGLQTVKVLDTIPKHVLQQTPGFPTKRWGSDHVALACELAFKSSDQ